MAKFMIKKQACFLYKTSIKFNITLIQLAPNKDITLCEETCVKNISLIIDYKAFTTSLR